MDEYEPEPEPVYARGHEGRERGRMRARFYAIARGSALECGALLDVVGLAKRLTPDRVDEGKRTLGRPKVRAAMLTKMCR